MEDASGLAVLAGGVAGLPGRVVVVHGGGPEISAWQERCGIAVEWRDGLRVTTREGLRVTAMVLSGWVNKRIVAALLAAGVDAVGISGEDGGLLVAERKDGGVLGEVGTVRAVRTELLQRLLGADLVPVVSPISRGPGGEPLNVNADEAAAVVAQAMAAERLLLVSDVPGLLVEGRVVREVTPAEARALIGCGVAAAGMRVKLGGAVAAAEAGVEVRIGDGSILSDLHAGTRMAASVPVEVA